MPMVYSAAEFAFLAGVYITGILQDFANFESTLIGLPLVQPINLSFCKFFITYSETFSYPTRSMSASFKASIISSSLNLTPVFVHPVTVISQYSFKRFRCLSFINAVTRFLTFPFSALLFLSVFFEEKGAHELHVFITYAHRTAQSLYVDEHSRSLLHYLADDERFLHVSSNTDRSMVGKDCCISSFEGYHSIFCKFIGTRKTIL